MIFEIFEILFEIFDNFDFFIKVATNHNNFIFLELQSKLYRKREIKFTIEGLVEIIMTPAYSKIVI